MEKTTDIPAGGNGLLNEHSAPELLADEAVGMSWLGGVLRITLASWRADWSKSPAPTERVVVGRIAMPIPAAEALYALLGDTLAKMKAQQEASGQAGPKPTMQ